MVCASQVAKLDPSLLYLAHDYIRVRSTLDKALGSLSAGLIKCTFNFKKLLVCMPQAAKLDTSLSHLAHDCIGVRYRLDNILGSLIAGSLSACKT